jgi:hypothetical protein
MKYSRSIFMLFALFISLPVTSSLAVMADDSMGKELFINSSDLRWDNAPPSMPMGAKVSVLLGDPHKSGPFVMRMMTPANYTIPPHFHSQAETLTIISGTVYLGDDDKFDPTMAHALYVGGFHYLPAKAHHFAFTRAPAIVEIHGHGPFDIIYLNPADDPQKARRE